MGGKIASPLSIKRASGKRTVGISAWERLASVEGQLRQVAQGAAGQAQKGYVEKQACQQVILLSCILTAYLKENTGR